MKKERKVNLEINYCVHCQKNTIPPDTFPHYCKSCMKYLNEHGRLPDVDLPVEQTKMVGFDEEIPEENR